MCSGDTDAVVPITATRYSIDALKLPTVTNWYPWYDNGRVSTKKSLCFFAMLCQGDSQSFTKHSVIKSITKNGIFNTTIKQ